MYSLDKLGFATRSQLQQVHDLGTVRNANRILRDMSEYIHHFRLFENVFYINKNGYDFIGLDKEPLKRNSHVEHYLMRNDMFIYYNCPDDWKNEYPVTFKSKVDLGNGIIQNKEKSIVPDAMFTVNKIYHFLEVDNLQNMKENKKKIDVYKDLALSIKEQFKHTPTIVYYTSSENRKSKLDEWCDRAGLHYRVFTKRDV